MHLQPCTQRGGQSICPELPRLGGSQAGYPDLRNSFGNQRENGGDIYSGLGWNLRESALKFPVFALSRLAFIP